MLLAAVEVVVVAVVAIVEMIATVAVAFVVEVVIVLAVVAVGESAVVMVSAVAVAILLYTFYDRKMTFSQANKSLSTRVFCCVVGKTLINKKPLTNKSSPHDWRKQKKNIRNINGHISNDKSMDLIISLYLDIGDNSSRDSVSASDDGIQSAHFNEYFEQI
uniref:Uncharacterized protein n=1 Tax=Glossina pallidipes TaxID=7398 RepID=A0A1B0A0Q4_GLOPL